MQCHKRWVLQNMKCHEKWVVTKFKRRTNNFFWKNRMSQSMKGHKRLKVTKDAIWKFYSIWSFKKGGPIVKIVNKIQLNISWSKYNTVCLLLSIQNITSGSIYTGHTYHQFDFIPKYGGRIHLWNNDPHSGTS